MRRNTLITLGLSTAFGGMAILLTRGWINNAVTAHPEQARAITLVQPPKKMETVPVLVADMPLNFGDRLTPQNIRLVEFPVGAVPEGSFADFDALFTDPSKPTVVLNQMAANEPILSFKLSGPAGRATLSSLLGEDMRAVSIRVNDVTGVAGFVQPGDTVDVYFTQQMEDKGAPTSKREFLMRGEQTTKNYQNMTLVQNIKILGTGRRSETVNNQVKLVKTVTLEVSAEQAQKLTLAMRVGDLSLSLRQAGSQVETASEILRSKDLGADAATKPVAKKSTQRRRVRTTRTAQPSGVASVIVVRDGKMNQVSVFKDAGTKAKLAGG